MPIKAPILISVASVLLAAPTITEANDDLSSQRPIKVAVSAGDLDLSRASEREKLIERSLELARNVCVARQDQATPCHVEFVVTDGGKPKWLKQTYRDYLARF